MSEYRITAKTRMQDIWDAEEDEQTLVWRTAEYFFEFYETPSEESMSGGVVVYMFGPDGKVGWSGGTSFVWDNRAIDVMRDAREAAELQRAESW